MDWLAVGIADHLDLAALTRECLADFAHQRQSLRLHGGAAGIEQAGIVDPHDRRIHAAQHADLALGDFGREKSAQPVEHGGRWWHRRRRRRGGTGADQTWHMRRIGRDRAVVERAGRAGERVVEARIDQRQHTERRGARHPHRHGGAPGTIRRGDALPMRRQGRIARRAGAANSRVDILAQPVDFGRSARAEPVAAHVAEREADIHQFEHREELAGAFADLLQYVEEPLAGTHLLMKGRYQRALRPGTLAAPGGGEHHVIEAGAERVMRGTELIDRDLRLAPGDFEIAQGTRRTLTQIAGIGRLQRVAQACEQLQQGRGGGEQRCRAEIERLGATARRRWRGGFGTAAGRRRRRCGGWAPAARRWANDRAVAVVGFGKRIVAHPRIAQSSSFMPGNSPETCRAKAPEFCICCQCGLPRSSSK